MPSIRLKHKKGHQGSDGEINMDEGGVLIINIVRMLGVATIDIVVARGVVLALSKLA